MNKENALDYLPLVQALAEGKVIQHKCQMSDKSYAWVDIEYHVNFCLPADWYRIKHEPREILVNEWKQVGKVVFDSPEEAAEHANRYGIGHVTTRYREVIE